MKNVPIFSKLLILLFAFVVSLGIISTYSLETLEKSMVDGRKEEIKAVTDAVLSVAQHYQDLVESGELAQEDAIERFYADMVALRFSDGIGYFFSSTSDGTLLMHAASPALKGQNIWNFKGASGGYVIRNIVAAAQNGGEYFVDLSTKPGKPKDQFFEKLYYAVTLPWGDHIGTGLYIDDINDAFRAQATNIIMFSGFAVVVILGLGLGPVDNHLVSMSIAHKYQLAA